MKVKMETLMAGPSGISQIGSVEDLPEDEARALIDAGYASEYVEEPGSPPSPEEAKPEEGLVELVGDNPADALAAAGFSSIDEAQEAIASGQDLEAIDGVGPATIRKIERYETATAPPPETATGPADEGAGEEGAEDEDGEGESEPEGSEPAGESGEEESDEEGTEEESEE